MQVTDSFEENMAKICGREKLNSNFHEQSLELEDKIVGNFQKSA